jgi:gamma-glutamylcyclotransferase (GGCT)/AIG2-like uncharacterized protein YtfP
MKLFLYGTLADPAALGRCAGRPVRHPPLPARLSGYRRVLLRGARYPTLRRAPDGEVHGVVVRVNADMFWRLKKYESARYRTIRVQLQTPAGPDRALCFYGDAPTLVGWTPDAKIMALRSRSF